MDPFQRNIDPRTLEGGWKKPAKQASYYSKIHKTAQHATAHSPWQRIAPGPAFLEINIPSTVDSRSTEFHAENCRNCEFTL